MVVGSQLLGRTREGIGAGGVVHKDRPLLDRTDPRCVISDANGPSR